MKYLYKDYYGHSPLSRFNCRKLGKRRGGPTLRQQWAVCKEFQEHPTGEAVRFEEETFAGRPTDSSIRGVTGFGT